ncbi:TPA: NUMOD3 domain-containing DNA-binding protein [Yersinia enterocolitica]|nr:GIY-YIG nuclease family protein [Yersinia enterocolitica]HEF9707912.1 GIY-YIG nuclease family protein [Yersinia enterocolitica]
MKNASIDSLSTLWKVPGVYQITNVNTRECYIGSTTNLANRWSVHKYELRTKQHSNKNLQEAWEEFGADAFSFLVLCLVKSADELIAAEQRYMDEIIPDYNIAPNAGSSRGIKLSEERKQQISEQVKGKGNYWYGKTLPCAGASKRPDVRAKLSKMHSGSGNPMYGITPPHAKLTDEQVRSIRIALSAGESSLSLAKKFDVSKGAIQHIKKGRSYRRVA